MTIDTIEYVPCVKCDGGGSVTIKVTGITTDGTRGQVTQTLMPCPYCNTTGMMKKSLANLWTKADEKTRARH